MYKPVFMLICGLPQAFPKDLRPATIIRGGGLKGKISIYVVNVNVSYIVGF
jgi:hypothetical protein